jgi:hypothetical protein
MNTIYVLLLITSTGISEGYTFNSMYECQTVAMKVKQHVDSLETANRFGTICVEKKTESPEVKMKQIMSMFKGMIAEMKEMQK